jgi:hypothetical protein
MQFLNQDTPVFQGTEALARKLGYPVMYIQHNPPKARTLPHGGGDIGGRSPNNA